MISATRKSSGKTTLSMALAAALVNQKKKVQCFKKGPDYIDSMWLRAASGKPCFNLDFNTQTPKEIISTFVNNSCDQGINLIEANKGLFDGMDLHGKDSNEAIARLLKSPVILIVDTEGMTRGVVPIVKGYLEFDETKCIKGIILNKVAGPRHESKLVSALETYTDIPIMGTVQRDADISITERHLGLMNQQEFSGLRSLLKSLGEVAAKSLDIPAIESVAAKAAPLSAEPAVNLVSNFSGIRIGVARDNAFNFYYEDDLQALEKAGVDIAFFDLTRDKALPEVDALIIGGGFPETHLPLLQENKEMIAAIRNFANQQKPIYAECGGLMYLGEKIICRDVSWNMAGVLPIDTCLTDKPVGRGCVKIEPCHSHPWPGMHRYQSINAHEFHYSKIVQKPDELQFGYKVKRGYGLDGVNDGICYGNVLAGYSHLRCTANFPWINCFLNWVAEINSRLNLKTA